ncbi:hypothetical protein [Aureivirga sp. CE67]|uniref:hypothetical protein n=1 Tax=Aureivirga sp. CE67 TaxID=1788983 RepID=UPI0018C95270|nr:hypothetical protein [Aureivirga sp. CE67]
MKKITLLLFISLFIFSCGGVKEINIEKPDPQTPESLKTYLDKRNVNYQNTDLYTLASFEVMNKLIKEDKFNFPEIYFFNKNKERVINRANLSECFNIISDINDVNKSETDSSDSLENWTKIISPLYTENKTANANYDAYVIINWFTEVPESINEQSFKWYQEIKQEFEGKMNVKVFLVSFDMQEKWIPNKKNPSN